MAITLMGEGTEESPYLVHSPVSVEPAGSLIMGTVSLAGTSGSVIEISDGGETYTLNNGINPTFILPNMFPGVETTVTLIENGLSSSVTFMAPAVEREACESSGIIRVSEDKQSIVYARESGAYAILTTSSGYNNKYGVLAFVINEDNEIVLNDSMTSEYLYSDLSVSGEKPFLLNDGTPFGVNLKYAWRGSNTDALEICVKLCLQGE